MKRVTIIPILAAMLLVSVNCFAPDNPEARPGLMQIFKTQEQYYKAIRVKRLIEAFMYVESRGNPYKIGSSGEYGYFQYLNSTWKLYSTQTHGTVLDITDPVNQIKVTELKLHELIDNGYSDAEIAAIWNSGSPHNWENKIGVNKYGAKYNVPKYVEIFIKTLEKIDNINYTKF